MRARTAARAVTAAAVLVVLLLGIPAALVALGGNPLPDQIPTLDQVQAALTRPDDGSLFLGALLWLGWAGWATFAVATLLEVPAQLRGVRAPHVPGLGIQQRAAAGLVSAVILAFAATTVASPAAATTGAPSGSTTAAPAYTATDWSQPADATGGGAGTAGPDAAADTAATLTTDPNSSAATTAAPVHTVQLGDTLWDLAEQYLGDGGKWRQIADLNYGAPQPDGAALDTTHTLQPGWTLTLPTAAATTQPAGTSGTHLVERGDTLSQIAQEHLGDGHRYPEIAQASAATIQPDGRTLTDPDVIHPGWHLTIPAATPAQPSATAAPGATDAPTEQPSPATPEPAPEPAQETPTPQGGGMPDVAPEQAQGALGSSVPASEPAHNGSSDTNLPPDQPQDSQRADAAEEDVDQATGNESDEGFGVRTAGGIGALLAAGLLAILGAKRRRQLRRRRPGERLPLAPQPAQVTELEIRAVEDPVGLGHVDTALRELAVHHRLTRTPLPQLRAARLTTSHLELYLTTPVDLPAPWDGTSDPTVWALPHGQLRSHHDARDRHTDTRAPWPSLVTIGQDSEDAHVLVDLEHVTALGIQGDPTETLAVITALAIELATSAWGDDLQVTLVGFAPELPAALDTGRVRHLDRVERLVVELEGRAEDVTRVMLDAGVPDLPTARGLGVALDAWAPEVVLLSGGVPDELRDRLDAVLQRVPRVGIAAVTGAGTPMGEWSLQLDPDHPHLGVLQPAGITIRPQRLAEADYAQVLGLLLTADDVAVPGPDWAARLPAHEPAIDDLPEPDDEPQHHQVDHEEPAETRAADLKDEAAAAAASADTTPVDAPTPDAGSHDAGAAQHTRPSDQSPALASVSHLPGSGPLIRVLGKVQVTGARGTAPSSAKSNHTGPVTELLTFLAVHGSAASGEEIAEHLIGRSGNWSLNTVRTRATQARTWLGTDNAGRPYLPSATDAGRYELHPDVRTDWDTWLDLVGPDAATAPTSQLLAALDLVRDQPFAGVRARQYGWAETIRNEMLASIVDVAHECARRALLDGDHATARRAAAIGRRVDPANELIWRDALKAEYLAGDAAGLARVKSQLYALADDLDTELEDETDQLIHDLDNRAGDAVAL